MLTRALASLSQTPQFESGMRAFEVQYRTNDGDKCTAVLVSGDAEIGEQIRSTLFARHPEATDYTFREFDYLAFQGSVALRKAFELTLYANNERGELEL